MHLALSSDCCFSPLCALSLSVHFHSLSLPLFFSPQNLGAVSSCPSRPTSGPSQHLYNWSVLGICGSGLCFGGYGFSDMLMKKWWRLARYCNSNTTKTASHSQYRQSGSQRPHTPRSPRTRARTLTPDGSHSTKLDGIPVSSASNSALAGRKSTVGSSAECQRRERGESKDRQSALPEVQGKQESCTKLDGIAAGTNNSPVISAGTSPAIVENSPVIIRKKSPSSTGFAGDAFTLDMPASRPQSPEQASQMNGEAQTQAIDQSAAVANQAATNEVATSAMVQQPIN